LLSNVFEKRQGFGKRLSGSDAKGDVGSVEEANPLNFLIIDIIHMNSLKNETADLSNIRRQA
jgi:hypothetical protein